MLFIAAGFYYMNKADPDCGTTFSWTTKAFGPWAGWLGGWAALIAQIIVIANLSQIAGEYSFLLVGADSLAASTFWVTVVGVIWIIVMSWICYVGIEASAKTQYFLLAAEIITLFLFAVVALWKVYTSDPVELGPPVPELAQPAQHLVQQRSRRGGARRDLHLLGLGLDGERQRGDRGLDPDARRGRDPEHDHPRRHLRRRGDRGHLLPRARSSSRTTSSTCWRPSGGTSSARRSTSC